jgi:hypothetical protein
MGIGTITLNELNVHVNMQNFTTDCLSINNFFQYLDSS